MKSAIEKCIENLHLFAITGSVLGQLYMIYKTKHYIYDYSL